MFVELEKSKNLKKKKSKEKTEKLLCHRQFEPRIPPPRFNTQNRNEIKLIFPQNNYILFGDFVPSREDPDSLSGGSASGCRLRGLRERLHSFADCIWHLCHALECPVDMPGQIGNWYSARGRGDGQTDLRRRRPATVFSRAEGGRGLTRRGSVKLGQIASRRSPRTGILTKRQKRSVRLPNVLSSDGSLTGHGIRGRTKEFELTIWPDHC